MQSITGLLNSKHNVIVVDAITILIYLYSDQTKSEVTTPEIVQTMERLKDSPNKMVSNLAHILLQKIIFKE